MASRKPKNFIITKWSGYPHRSKTLEQKEIEAKTHEGAKKEYRLKYKPADGLKLTVGRKPKPLTDI